MMSYGMTQSLSLALLTAAALACSPARDGSLLTTGAEAQTRAQVTQNIEASRRTAFVDATEKVKPAVVSISVTSRQQVQARSDFDFFFVPQTREEVVQSSGTGFIIKPDGVIVTNQHVVANAEKIVVTLADGTDLPAQLIGADALTDIAVVKVAKTGLPVAKLGTSTDLLTGEWVVALGNPYGYLLGNAEPTVTVGVVSATHRNILPSGEQPGLYLDMIQTDAAINPGNSGGPLTNALGEVVAVNSSIFSAGGGSIGLGFAIPIERAARVADELLKTGSVRRAWTGLDVEGPQSMRNWKTAGGVVVSSVAVGGPASRAGLKAGDVLTEANGRRLRNYLDWEAVKLDSHVGDAVAVTLRTGGTRRIVTGDLPTVTAEKISVLKDLQLVSVTPAVQTEKGVKSEQGALVYRISGQIGAQTGLREGDVIVAVNNVRIRSADQLAKILDQLGRKQSFRVFFEREGQILFTDLAFS
jgi:serine protease Do